MEFKEDLRIQKTRRDLRKSILNLLREKPLEKISVTEICDNAMINRMTFYKYYEDKFILLDDAFNEIKDNILKEIPKNKNILSLDDASNYYVGIIEIVIKYLDNNKDLLYAIEKNASEKLIGIITKISEGAINDLLIEINKTKPLKYSIPITASFIYGGFIYSIQYLIHHKEEMNKAQLNNLIKDLKNNIFKIEFLYK